MASTYTYELNDEQQNILLLLMEGGNYRKRTVPYSLMSIEGDGFNCALYQKEKHGRRKLCIQGSKAQDFVEFFLEPGGVVPVTMGSMLLVSAPKISWAPFSSRKEIPMAVISRDRTNRKINLRQCIVKCPLPVFVSLYQMGGPLSINHPVLQREACPLRTKNPGRTGGRDSFYL